MIGIGKENTIFRLETLSDVDLLLVECLRIDLDKDPDDSDLEALESACRSVEDWNLLVPRANYEGVLGWAHEALTRLGDRVVPAEIISQLRHARIFHTTRIAAAAADTSSLLNELSARGVKHMLLKGPFLTEQVYGRSDLRFYTDIDLMIREENLGAAGQVLTSLGYRLLEGSGAESAADDGHTQVHYYREGSLPVDLHWQLINLPSHMSSIRIDIDQIWSSAVPTVIAGAETLVLSPEDAVMFQCAHMTAHHDFNRLLWFKDVEQVINRFGPGLDWDLLVARTSRYGLKTFVYYSILFSACVCGGLEVPDRVISEIKPRYPLARLFERLVRNENILEMQQNRRRPALELWLVMRDGTSKRVGAVIKRIFPDVGWYLKCYPFLPRIKRQWIYYTVYPALVVLRLIKRPIRLDLSETRKSR